MRQIITLGGGGFSMESENTLLDDYILSLIPAQTQRPHICFIPTASGDAPTYCDKFMSAFPIERAETSILHLFDRTIVDIATFLSEQDIIYVGGGNTANLLAIWRLHGVDIALRRAYDQGVILAGISAGMNCWFEASITDSFNSSEYMGLQDGLKFISGSACPHYDGEAKRRAVYHSLIERDFPAGYAVQDYTALHFIDEELVEVVSSRLTGAAYYVHRADSQIREDKLSVKFLG